MAELSITAPGGAQWWRNAVFYQVYPRSFADANGDGMGDLPGITSKLPYLKELGVDGVWISPFYTSPQADAGYDVADYRNIDPTLGTLVDAEALLKQADSLGIKVVVDLVPNHTSDEHEWFKAALAAGPGSPERERYIFRDGLGENGDTPPNNWNSVFGGRAWTRVNEPNGTPGQWYLHIFDTKQPDLNWEHPEVREEFHDILRFWLDRGVAGFRVDVAHGLIKADGLPDWDQDLELLEGATADGKRPPMWDQDGVHEIYRAWRKVLDEYDDDRMLVAEAWVEPPERLARYVRADEMHQAFNFDFLVALWDAKSQRHAIVESLQADAKVGAPTTWVLSNHDVVRHATRLAIPATKAMHNPDGVRATDPQPDLTLGLQRARAATAIMLALPGSAYLYQGEELGLPDHTSLPDDVRQDPTFTRTKGERVGRDGCRVPIPWKAGGTSNGFGPSGTPWLPQPERYAVLAADQQQGVEGSTLELYRTILKVRRELDLGHGTITFPEAGANDVLAFQRVLKEGALTVMTNFGKEPVALPEGSTVVLASDELTGGQLPQDTTVWLR